MANYADIFKGAKRRTKTVQEIADTLPSQERALFVNSIKEVDTIVHDMRAHCRKVALFTLLITVVQLEVSSCRLANVYDYATVPIIVKLFHSLVTVANNWVIILAIIVGVEATLWFKRPVAWEKFLLRAPIIRKVMLPLCFYRYYWTKSFGVADNWATAATGNKAFDIKNEEMMSCVEEDYPLLQAASGIDKKKWKRDDYRELTQYAQQSLEFAAFDFRELFSYTCMALTILVTVVVTVVCI